MFSAAILFILFLGSPLSALSVAHPILRGSFDRIKGTVLSDSDPQTVTVAATAHSAAPAGGVVANATGASIALVQRDGTIVESVEEEDSSDSPIEQVSLPDGPFCEKATSADNCNRVGEQFCLEIKWRSDGSDTNKTENVPNYNVDDKTSFGLCVSCGFVCWKLQGHTEYELGRYYGDDAEDNCRQQCTRPPEGPFCTATGEGPLCKKENEFCAEIQWNANYDSDDTKKGIENYNVGDATSFGWCIPCGQRRVQSCDILDGKHTQDKRNFVGDTVKNCRMGCGDDAAVTTPPRETQSEAVGEDSTPTDKDSTSNSTILIVGVVAAAVVVIAGGLGLAYSQGMFAPTVPTAE